MDDTEVLDLLQIYEKLLDHGPGKLTYLRTDVWNRLQAIDDEFAPKPEPEPEPTPVKAKAEPKPEPTKTETLIERKL